MKNVLLVLVFAGLFSFSLTGCGSSEPTVIAPVAGNEGGVPADAQKEYEAQMQSGGSSRATAPK